MLSVSPTFPFLAVPAALPMLSCPSILPDGGKGAMHVLSPPVPTSPGIPCATDDVIRDTENTQSYPIGSSPLWISPPLDLSS